MNYCSQLLTYASKGCTREEIIRMVNGNDEYFKLLKMLNNQELKEYQEYLSIVKRDTFNFPPDFVLIAEDYIFSIEESDQIVNTFLGNTEYYILPKTLEFITRNRYNLKSIKVLSKLLDAINSKKISILKTHTFYNDNSNANNRICKNDINSIIKTLISIKNSNNYNNVYAITNDMYSIYYLLVYGIKVIHNITTEFNEENIMENNDNRHFVLDTCYILNSLKSTSLYYNSTTIIYSCTLEELIRNYSALKTCEPNIFYLLIDFIQSVKSKITFKKSVISSYQKLFKYENDTTLLSEIINSNFDKNTLYLVTEDITLQLESMIFGVNIILGQEYTNLFEEDSIIEKNQQNTNEFITETENVSNPEEIINIENNEPFLSISITKINKKWYIHKETKDRLKFEIVHENNLTSLLTKEEIIARNVYYKFDIKHNLIKLNNAFYRLVDVKKCKFKLQDL